MHRLPEAAGMPNEIVVHRSHRNDYDHALRADEDVLAAARYIVANPLRAGLVGSIRDYPFWDAVWL